MKNIEFLKIADDELRDAFEYYERLQKDLGYRFVKEVYGSIELIKSYPQGWSKISKKLRRCLVKTFPFGIVYQNRDDIILIVAIANLHKKPDYWIDRIL